MPNAASFARALLPASLLLAIAAAAPAHANTIRYRIGGAAVVSVADGAAADLSPAANTIKISIDTSVPWGIGTLYVRGSITAVDNPPGTGKPSITINALQITNQLGQIIAAPIWFEHSFPTNDNPMYAARLAGRFDSLVTPGTLQGGQLTYLARVRNEDLAWKTIASGATPALAGAAPIPFLFAGGPLGYKKVNLERQDLTIYLDSPGDSILINATDASKFYAASLLPLAAIPALRRRRR